MVHKPESFVALCQAHGIASLRQLDGLGASVMERLANAKNTIAVNSPMLEVVAARLGVSVEIVRRFAHGAPMSERFRIKIAKQIQNGTVPRGAQTRSTGGSKKTFESTSPFATWLRTHHQMTMTAASKASGIPFPYFLMLSSKPTGVAPNHPVVMALATFCHVSPQSVKRFALGTPLSGGAYARVHNIFARHIAKHAARQQQTQLMQPQHDPDEGDRPNTAVVVHMPRLPARPARPDVDEVAEVDEVRTRRGGPQNKLRRADTRLREVARALVATVNVSIMKGEQHMPPIPLADLRLVLEDYLTVKGVRVNVLIDADFLSAFDP